MANKVVINNNGKALKRNGKLLYMPAQKTWQVNGMSVNGNVHEMFEDSFGNVWIVGAFTEANASPTTDVTKWNGTSLDTYSVPGGNSSLYGIAEDSSGNIYVCGWHGIQKWDGTTWASFGTLSSGGLLRGIAIDSNDNIYAAGSFTTIDGVTASRVAKWDGTTWTSLSSSTDDVIYGVKIDSSDNVYVAGRFTTIDGVTASRVAKWDGSSWSALGSGSSFDLNTIAIDSSDHVYVAGSSGILKVWDGTSWTDHDSGESDISKIYSYGTDVYLGATTDGLKFDGSTFTVIVPGTNNINAICYTSLGEIFIGGAFSVIINGTITADGLARFSE